MSCNIYGCRMASPESKSVICVKLKRKKTVWFCYFEIYNHHHHQNSSRVESIRVESCLQTLHEFHWQNATSPCAKHCYAHTKVEFRPWKNHLIGKAMTNLSSSPKNKRNRAKERPNRTEIDRYINILTRGRVISKIRAESALTRPIPTPVSYLDAQGDRWQDKLK